MPAPVRIDIRQLGGIIDPDEADNAVLANPRAAYFPDVGPTEGYEYPRYAACVCYVPYTLHRDYGGELLLDDIREKLLVHIADGEYPIIRWAGVIPEWVSITPRQNCVQLVWYNENPSYTFRIYRSLYIDRDFELIATVSGSTYGNNTYNDCQLVSGTVYYYYITAVSSDGIESPKSVTQGVEVL